MAGRLRPLIPMMLMTALMSTAPGCSTPSPRAAVADAARAFAADPAVGVPDGLQVAEETVADDGTVTATLIGDDPCLQVTVTWPAEWLLDGTGDPDVSRVTNCEATP